MPDTLIAVSVTAVALAAAAWAIAASWEVGPPTASWVRVGYHGFGVPLIVAGGVLWARARRARVGLLLIALGTAYYLQFLRTSDDPVLFGVGFCLAFLYVGVFAHLALSVPSGRLRGPVDRAYVAVSYLACVGTQVARYLTDRPTGRWNYNIPQVNTGWAIAGSLVMAVLGVVGIALVLRRLLSALALRRRHTGPVWAIMITVGALVIVSSVSSATGRPLGFRLGVEVLMLGGAAVGIVVAYLVSVGLQWRRELRIAELPARLGGLRAPPLAALQTALAEAAGDPTLRLLLPRRDGALTDLAGHPAADTEDHARARTPVTRGGELLCVIEHDAALAEGGRAITSAIALTGLVMENVRLYVQVIESRRRLLEAELAERRRIERALHDGAQQGFFVVLTLLGMAHSQAAAEGSPLAGQLATAKGRLTDAIKVLRDLSQGLHPRSLVAHGLRETVADLARHHPGQLTYEVPDRRWPPDVESTAYFVIAEGVTNAIKHATPGTAIRVRLAPDGEDLLVEVADDGQGGADASGGGLRGLTERVAAAGGELILDSPHGGGTRLLARLPGEFAGEPPAAPPAGSPAGAGHPAEGDGL
ncbi:histidine kinase [Nonomuraea sp. NPDC050691]|uniref:sensor histidine kinase n=1 Tax=Nonomuraea sp. NPDC050691 TaxID=3155661 RepID=UPI00340287F5